MSRRILVFLSVLILMVFSLVVEPVKSQASVFDCTTTQPLISDLLGRTSQTQWAEWIRRLSGAKSARLAGEDIAITSRHSFDMFAGADYARAYDYVLERLLEWLPASQVS